MGCDIHMYVEKRKNGKWVAARPELYIIEDAEYDTVPNIPYDKRIYVERNYSLFAILANVRNCYDFVPITEPRGLPDDVCMEIKKISDMWCYDGHSHSYISLEELLDYDWTQTTICRGWVNGPQYWNWCRWRRDNNESPEEWCRGVGGVQVKHVSVDEMDKQINMLTEDKQTYEKRKEAIDEALSDIYCIIQWKQPYYKCVRKFLSDCIPQLLQIGKPDEVRIVFWFDN